MLKTILPGELCAECRNCCIFEVQSAWEVPTFSADAVSRLNGKSEYQITEENGRYRIALPYDKSGAAQPCPFLDPETGCTLPPEEKPFACSLWPVRVMRGDDGTPQLALYHGCPGVPESVIPKLTKLLDDGLRERIFTEAEHDPSIILPYYKNYIWL